MYCPVVKVNMALLLGDHGSIHIPSRQGAALFLSVTYIIRNETFIIRHNIIHTYAEDHFYVQSTLD